MSGIVINTLIWFNYKLVLKSPSQQKNMCLFIGYIYHEINVMFAKHTNHLRAVHLC